MGSRNWYLWMWSGNCCFHRTCYIFRKIHFLYFQGLVSGMHIYLFHSCRLFEHLQCSDYFCLCSSLLMFRKPWMGTARRWSLCSLIYSYMWWHLPMFLFVRVLGNLAIYNFTVMLKCIVGEGILIRFLNSDKEILLLKESGRWKHESFFPIFVLHLNKI
jgi:hypothetical protein